MTWTGMATATKRQTAGVDERAYDASRPVSAAAKRPSAAAKKPGGKKPPSHGGNSQENAFEGMHARDENGKFTSGADRNRGPQQGDKSRDVQAMQTLLTRLGYANLDSDGDYGPKTAAAVRRAQKNLGITGEEGFGPKLRAALRKEYESIGGDAAFSKDDGKGGGSGRGRSGGGSGGGRRSSSGSGKRGSGSRGKKKPTPKKGDGAGVRGPDGRLIHDPSNLADGPLTPDAGRFDKPWPQEWGKEPPKFGPHGARRAEGYKDGSAVYEDGWVWDPDTHKFRLVGQNAYAKAPKKKAPAEKGYPMSTALQFKRGGAVHAPGREHKGLPVTGGVKVLTDEGEGIVEAVVSVTGIEDEVRDIIVPGAYTRTLTKRIPKGVFSHDWEKPVARTMSIKELLPGDPELPKTTSRGEPWPVAAGALMVKMQFNLDTERGRDAYSDVQFFGDEAEWSIGYNVPKGGARINNKGVRCINDLDLYEYSPVLFGAMPLAGTRGQKDLDGEPFEVKALPGSYEELTERIVRAIDHLVNGNVESTDDRKWVWIRATMPDSVIVRVEGKHEGREHEDDLLMYPYKEVDGQLVIGEPVPVKITESVVPDPDSEDEDGEVVAVTETKGRAPELVDGEEPEPDPSDPNLDEEDPEGEEKSRGFLSASELDEMRALRESLT